MKRRRLLQAIAASPAAAPALLAQGPGSRLGQAGTAPARIATVPAGEAATPAPRFFSPIQLETLRKLAATLMPPLNGNPGAIEAGVPEFLDFLAGSSPAARQKLYRAGLDHLEAEAKRLHAKSFPSLEDGQIDAILKPMLAPWTYDPPADPRKHFLAAARADIRAATLNSREWAAAASSAPSRRRRGGGGTVGLYWLPIDPTRPA